MMMPGQEKIPDILILCPHIDNKKAWKSCAFKCPKNVGTLLNLNEQKGLVIKNLGKES